jgi:hypothetical protein
MAVRYASCKSGAVPNTKHFFAGIAQHGLAMRGVEMKLPRSLFMVALPLGGFSCPPRVSTGARPLTQVLLRFGYI